MGAMNHAPLVAGLVLFLGLHSLRIFADDWRSRQVQKLGEKPWKLIYTVVSLAGFALLAWGYGQARLAPIDLWNPPPWTRHLSALLILPAFVLLVAAYVPGTRIKAAVGHPMVLGTKVWAFGHLVSNGRLADVLLFGGFMLWAALDYRSLRARDRAAGRTHAAQGISRDLIAVAVGVAAWAGFAIWLHAPLIGVRPFG